MMQDNSEASKGLQVFNNPKFGVLRTEQDAQGNVLFSLADVCASLHLQVSATRARLKSCGVNSIKVATEVISHGEHTSKMQEQEMLFIDEPNLYRCIFQSRKKEAGEFQDWVFDEVLPPQSARQAATSPRKPTTRQRRLWQRLSSSPSPQSRTTRSA